MTSSNKRQRTTTSDKLCINDLPDGLLVGISSYLAKPSVGLFAIAMDPDNFQRTQTSKAILSNRRWNLLDFSDIEKSLAAKLSDDDIDKILKSIDAVNNLKILKLAGCVNITGSGLDTLRSSTVLEQIDMSLVGKHEVPLIEPEPLLSEDVCIPILDGIIGRGRGSSLKQLEFPKKWRKTQSIQMTQFLGRYNQYLTNQRYCCSKCDRICTETWDDDNEWIYRDPESMGESACDWYGTQNYACSQCVQHFCLHEDCADENGDNSKWCRKCEKEYCKRCGGMNSCRCCAEDFCHECSDMKECDGDCGRTICEDCSAKKTCSYCYKTRCRFCIQSHQCNLDGCNKVICMDCVESNLEGGRCDACSKSFCSTECRYLACGDEVSKACSTCSLAAASSFRRKLHERENAFKLLRYQ